VSQYQKLFQVHPATPDTAEVHLLNTFTVYWYPNMPRPRYRWRCACGYHTSGVWMTATEAENAYAAHSGITYSAWPPMGQAAEVTITITPELRRK